jgi:hypothetical protein
VAFTNMPVVPAIPFVLLTRFIVVQEHEVVLQQGIVFCALLQILRQPGPKQLQLRQLYPKADNPLE